MYRICGSGLGLWVSPGLVWSGLDPWVWSGSARRPGVAWSGGDQRPSADRTRPVSPSSWTGAGRCCLPCAAGGLRAGVCCDVRIPALAPRSAIGRPSRPDPSCPVSSCPAADRSDRVWQRAAGCACRPVRSARRPAWLTNSSGSQTGEEGGQGRSDLQPWQRIVKYVGLWNVVGSDAS